MKKTIIISVSLLLLVTGILYGPGMIRNKPIDPPQQTMSAYQKMDQLSQDIYQLTKEEKYSEAKQLIDGLGIMFAKTTPPKGLSIEALDTITETIVKAKRAFTMVKPDPSKLLWYSLQLRLTIDSLTHEEQPLWKNYYNAYKEHLNKMMLLAASHKQHEFAYAFAQNMQLYQTLKPALSVQASSQDMEKLLSIYSFFLKETRKVEYNWGDISNVLQELTALIDKIFLGKDESTLAMGVPPESPTILIALIGSILLPALSYVAWKKYKAEKKVRRYKKRSHD
ncbi:sporulation protein YpjB [Aneurinibacillus terranovensis]|uniref:sporulation protein YpjB n=1 Tax=Aneurinibacillus terranovensis TaxID=278991 RepID=UPI000425CEC5|nr:sporulation protein YpjB [Aneurinibacillus terranovensis]